MQESGTLKIITKTLPFLNISLYLNDIKPVQSLMIENVSEADATEIEIRIITSPVCIDPFSHTISILPAKRAVKIPLESLTVNRDFINSLSESEKATITIEIVEKEITVCSESFPLKVQPLEHFGGFQVLPQLIAAYVTPNHPYVYHIKRKAIEHLEKKGLITAFEGYQSNDPERVLQFMSAIYSAIQGEEIVYSSLPPGYEETGQRLRLLNTIQQEKFGNCIDLSLLFVACLEAVDLNPILIIVRGHAFVGCWLHNDKFSEIVNDDKTAITKRLSKGIREMAAIEATSVCKGNYIKFSDALNAGEAQLVQNENFLLSIDLKRARTLQIAPLPLQKTPSEITLDEEAIRKLQPTAMEDRFEIGTIYEDDLSKGNEPKTKQKIWERKLLDLSLRNNLLNLHMTRNMLQLVDIDISNLEDVLFDGKSFSILSNPNAEVVRKYNLFTAPLHNSSPLYQLANDELKHNRLLTHYHQQDLDNILVYIHKNANQAIEENGSSTLYLAIGLLKWYDRKTPSQARYAPILLIPVELSRRSVNSKFILKSREEETMINITLVEFLRQEYQLNLGGLEQLPTDEKGIDVAKVMGILRRAIMQLKGWDVEEQLLLGNFSFSKLILWKDIVLHQEELMQNDMVRSLIEGKLSFSDNQTSQPVNEYETIPSQSIVLPISTDVSQMEAVLAAQQGRSFVLHGPPGTGKSQTITNIIADALYRGKRVLFVAAKKAALDVVHRRLEQIGLAPFTLELHSNKSKKSDVLQQLAKSIDTVKLTRQADYAQEAQRLDIAKQSINGYVDLLHKKQTFGWSLYDSITALENHKDSFFQKDLIPEDVMQQLNPKVWQQWTDWLPQFQSIAQLIIHPRENALTALNLRQYSSTASDEISIKTEELLKTLPEVQNKSLALAAAIHFPFAIQSKSDWEKFVEVIGALKSLPDIPLSMVRYLADKNNKIIFDEWIKIFDSYIQTLNRLKDLTEIPKEFIQYLSEKGNYSIYEEWSKTYKIYLNLLGNILNNYNRSVLTADIRPTEMQWKKVQQMWFLPKWWKSREIKKYISTFRNNPFLNDVEVEQLFRDTNELDEAKITLLQPSFGEVQKALKSLFKEEQTNLLDLDHKAALIYDLCINQIQEKKKVLSQNHFANIPKALKNLFQEEQTDITDLGNKSKLIEHLRVLLDHWERNGLDKWVKVWQEHKLEHFDEIQRTNLPEINSFLKISENLQELTNNFHGLYGYVFQVSGNWIEDNVTALQNIKKQLPDLRNWMIYIQLKREGELLNLQWLLSAFENKLFEPERIGQYFDFILHTSVAQSIISKYESLNLFNVSLFESKIEQYKKIAKEFQNITIQELRVKLAAQLPNNTLEAMQSSEIGILQKAIKNRGRGLSIRRLFDQIPALLPRVAPCMLMSPISVAQYFDLKTKHFDIVIFDEASQLPTCEAVSSLARAKQAIIVGDPKQMPPTSFFSTMKLDEENLDLEDLESILDDCLSLSVTSKYLLRHYRSKHESLIAFSNAKYYDNKLLTFPSSDDLNRKVKHHPVIGFYDKGKTRTNKFEADEIVQYIKSHYSDPKRRKFSLGVVTFSQSQQNLIEDKIQNLFMSDFVLEEFANESTEPLFVKNLENVQGDERDIILFSVGYGPDEEGKMIMNFGPLNREGGWRRLNVAITRARYEMHIFATLKTDQIDLNKTSAEGVAGLKAFLQFAEKGQVTVSAEAVKDKFNKQQLADSIREKLQEKGFEVKCNIGTSGFKIDLGIVHPERPQEYILGILVDGIYYYNACTTNDREMVMPSVLKSLGWNIHRIWTMDWYENADLILHQITEKVTRLQLSNIIEEEIVTESLQIPVFEPLKSMQEEVLQTTAASNQIPYANHSINPIPTANSETIYASQNRSLIKEQLVSIVKIEGPISKSLLYRRILMVWNTSRAGVKLYKHLDEIMDEIKLVQTHHHQIFYWSDNTTITSYRDNSLVKRSMEDIAPEEIMIALEEVVKNNLSIYEEELLRYLAKTFSFSKVGIQIENLLRYAIDTAVFRGKVLRADKRIKVL